MLYRLSPSLILTAMLWINDLSAGVSGFLPLPVRPPALDAKGVLPLSRASVHEAGHTAWAGSLESDTPDEEHAGSEARVHWDNEMPGKPEKEELYWKDENGNLHRVRHGLVDGRPEQSREQVASANSQGLNGVHNSVAALLHRNGIMFVKHDSTGSVVLYTPPRNEEQDSVPGVVVVARVIGGGKALRSSFRYGSGPGNYGFRKLSKAGTNSAQKQPVSGRKGGKSKTGAKKTSSVKKQSGRVSKRKSPARSQNIPALAILDGSIKDLLKDAEEKPVHLVLSRTDQTVTVDQHSQTSLPCSEETECKVKQEVTLPLYKVAAYSSHDALIEEASSMGLKEEYFTDKDLHPELKAQGLTDSVWDNLVAFLEMVQGKAIGDEKEGNFSSFMKWFRGRLAFQKSRSGNYEDLLDAYIDLCLQYMALKFDGRQLYRHLSYYQNAEMNRIVHLQKYVEENPDKKWSDFEKEQPERARALAGELASKSEWQDTDSYLQLEAAMKSSNAMKPEDLGGEWLCCDDEQ